MEPTAVDEGSGEGKRDEERVEPVLEAGESMVDDGKGSFDETDCVGKDDGVIEEAGKGDEDTTTGDSLDRR